MAPFGVLVIDDHPVVLSGLRLLLSGHPLFAIRAEAGTAAQARAAAEREAPDLVIADLVLGGQDGIGLIDDLLAIAPATRILVYSSHDETIYARHALRAGAKGYVSKAEGLDVIASALDTIAAGGLHVSPAVGRLLVSDFAAQRGASDLSALSARELQVLGLIGSGRTLGEMAAELSLSAKTIGTYRERLKVKLGFDSVRALESYAVTYRSGVSAVP